MEYTDINSLLEDFIVDISKNYSISQRNTNKKAAERLRDYLKDYTFIKWIAQIERSDVQKYINYLWKVDYGGRQIDDQLKYRPNFVYRNLSTLNKFFEFLAVHEEEYKLLDRPKAGLLCQGDFPSPHRKSAKYLPEWFDRMFRKKVLNIETFHHTRVNPKTKLEFLLLYHTGVRILDLVTLERECVIEKEGKHWLRVYSNKVKREYELPIVEELVSAVEEYKKAYKSDIAGFPTIHRGFRQIHPLFKHLKGSADITSGLRNKLRNFTNKIISDAKAQGVDTSFFEENRIHPHLFRHNAAKRLIRLGADPMLVAEFLGHKNLSMAQVYIEEEKGYVEEFLQTLNDGGVLEHLNFEPSQKMWKENLIFEHKDIIQKTETGWCTLVNHQTPCGENPYECWECDKLQPYMSKDYLGYLLKQLKIHMELLDRNIDMGFCEAENKERKVISRIKQFINIWHENMDKS